MAGSEEINVPAMQHVRLQTKAIILGYIMSRLDKIYLTARGGLSWQEAYHEAMQTTGEKATSFKNLRDEFDPWHSNERLGWRNRPLRANRERVMLELREVSNDALLELADRILRADDAAVTEAVDSLAAVTHVAHNVAERLLTGRRAEEYFLEHCQRLVGVPRKDILDLRQSALGYDFGIRERPQQSLEVKGLKQMTGMILFTDREWIVAKARQDDYYLIVVGNLSDDPIARVIQNPYENLEATCGYQRSISAIWRAKVTVQISPL